MKAARTFAEWRAHAERGEPDAAYMVGMQYQLGVLCPRDLAQSVLWLQRAAEREHVEAQHALGRAILEGMGAPKDRAEALRWLLMAASRGHAYAQFTSGQLMLDAAADARARDEAATWFARAAVSLEAMAVEAVRAGDTAPVPWHYLGIIHEAGRGVPVDLVTAYTWHSLAANISYPPAIDAARALAGTMTDDQIADARRRASRWIERASA